MIKKCGLLILFLIQFFISYGQEADFEAGYHGFLDNREYFNDYSVDQTFFGNGIYGMFDISKENHHVNIGVAYIYEFGTVESSFKPQLIANYKFDNKNYLFYFGSFHRENLLNYPISLITDSLDYYRPLIEGTLFRIKFNKGYEQAWMDWTSRQTNDVRETFLAGLSGKTQLGNLFQQHYILMYHYAHPAIDTNDISIQDNGGAALFLGYNTKTLMFFDEFELKLGEVYVYDRLRGEYDLRNYLSTCAGLKVYVKRFMLAGEMYIGDGLETIYGERIYKAKEYFRIDLGFLPFKNNNVNLIRFSIHIVDGVINYSQFINVKLNFTSHIFSL